MEKVSSRDPDLDSEEIIRLIEEQDRRDAELAQQAAVFDHAPDEVRAQMLEDPAFADYLAYRNAQQSIVDARISAQENEGHFYIT